MIGHLELVLILLGLVGVLAVVAERIRFPFPIMMVLGGIAIALVPELPEITLHSDLVLVVFLPPILYSAAFIFPWDEFRSNLRPILMMAVGLVLLTMVCVALAAHWLIPGMPLAVAFVLGAIVSPPDAVAAMAVLRNLRMPQRLLTVLEGESLVNDSSGLVAYQFAVAAVVTGSFSFLDASAAFVWEPVGGAALGLAAGWLASKIHARLAEPAVGVIFEILTPYIAYLTAERIGVSGVLAVVAAGMVVGNQAARVLNPATRMQGVAIWGFINYLMNGLIFILIGLEFPRIMDGLRGTPWWRLALYGGLVSAVVIAVRFVWIFPLASMMRAISPSWLKDPARLGNKGPLVVASWAGMRGVVSLAAALAVPGLIETGEAFPARNLVLFLTYSVIFSTLVLQGFTLPWVVRRMGVEEPDSDVARELDARAVILGELVALIEAERKRPGTEISAASLKILGEHFKYRLEHLRLRLDSKDEARRNQPAEKRFVSQLMERSRYRLAELRGEGRINEEMRRRLEYEFDGEEQRLSRALARVRE